MATFADTAPPAPGTLENGIDNLKLGEANGEKLGTAAPESEFASGTIEERKPGAGTTWGKGRVLEDGFPEDLVLPVRYVKGMGGDLVEARRRWIDTIKWRKEYKVDGLLEEPQSHFDVIKRFYPHFVYNRAKNGSLVYYELVGKINLPKMREYGVDLEGLIRHYIYITEFIWETLDEKEEGKLLTVMDLSGVRLSDFVGEAKTFMSRAARLVGAHYPERSFKIFIINAPRWFNLVWKFISQFMHANTKAKVSVAGSKYMDELKTLIDFDDIPSAIGGGCAAPYLDSPEEQALKAHTAKVLEAAGQVQTPLKAKDAASAK